MLTKYIERATSPPLSSSGLSPRPTPIPARTPDLKKQMTIIDDMGLIAETADTFKPHTQRENNRNTNTIKLGDFWGKKISRKVMMTGELSKAARKLKFERWKDGRSLEKLKNTPQLPHMLARLHITTPECTKEPISYLRAYSPQLTPRVIQNLSKSSKLKIINEIIQNCTEFQCKEDQRINLRPTKLLIKKSQPVKNLSKLDRMSIENNKKILNSFYNA